VINPSVGIDFFTGGRTLPAEQRPSQRVLRQLRVGVQQDDAQLLRLSLVDGLLDVARRVDALN